MDHGGGKFINKTGYTLTQIPEQRSTELYHCVLLAPPLTWWAANGTFWNTAKEFDTDMGSTPLLCQWIPALQKDRYLLPYMFHDFIYRHKKLLVSCVNGGAPRERYIGRGEADQLLREMIASEGGWFATRWLVWSGVRIGGSFAWKRRTKGAKQP